MAAFAYNPETGGRLWQVIGPILMSLVSGSIGFLAGAGRKRI